MTLKTLLHSLAIFLIVLYAGGLSAVHAQTAEEIFDRLKAKYDTIETLRTEFSQTMTSEFSDDVETSSGVLTMKKDQYRVETQSQTLITDGITTWVYLPYEKQVLINDYEEDEMTFSINDFFFNYQDQYEVTEVKTARIDGLNHHVLTMIPTRGDAFFLSVTLSMRDTDDVVTHLEVIDANGTTMAFQLTNIVLNPVVEDDLFHFTAPDEVEIVDLRSE